MKYRLCTATVTLYYCYNYVYVCLICLCLPVCSYNVHGISNDDIVFCRHSTILWGFA